MSTSGVFSLLTNDGKADRLIMATEFLRQRIKNIVCSRKAANMKDCSPTLKDIEKTHILFMNAHFKPFAAIGFEYMKVRAQSGNPALGNTITFSIPQFGDFFHDMVMRATLSSCTSSTTHSVPAAATANNALIDGQFPASGANTGGVVMYDWDNTTALHTNDGDDGSSVTYSAVDLNGVAVAAVYTDYVRYVEFPGERLCQEVRFDVNGNPLDVYEDSVTVMLRKFTVPSDKMVGYKRLVGQETELQGFSSVRQGAVDDNNRVAAVALTSATDGVLGVPGAHTGSVANTEANFLATNFPDAAWSADAVTHSASQGYQTMYRQSLRAVDGLQTPKLTQPAHDLWCKFRFWFAERVDQALASVAIPSGQRYITVKLATQAQIVQTAPAAWVKRVYTSVAGLVTTEYRPLVRTATSTISEISLSQVELYVNNLFVNPEIHDIYIARIGFSLIRVFRQHKVRVNTAGDEDRQLSQLKWPIEYMFVGLRPVWNTDSTNSNMHRDWHRMTKVVDIVSHHTTGDASLSDHRAPGSDSYVKELKTIDQVTLSAHGIKIFDDFSERFFSAYTPLAFGGSNIVTPDDEGCLMFNFALYPGAYQPSGHINVSRAREFYLKWSSSYTSPTCPSELLVIGLAINFLLIANGSAVLRFST